jgi:hypothetical protein
MTTEAAAAARALADVLQTEADRLASDDLATVSAAMSAVRGAARTVEAALTERGWGGGVLSGLGEVEDLDDDDDLEVPAGRRLTYQSRFDFVVTDEAAFLGYLEGRARDAGLDWSLDDLATHNPLLVLAELDGLSSKDYTDVGLAFAGGQEAVHEVPLTLWEMDDESREDAFPTAGP